MCVAAIAWQAHPRWQLIAIANRDEFHDRPAAALTRWTNGVVAGRDLEAGGTWLGAADGGRFALVTNFRAPGFPQANRPSRGGLVTGWLLGDESDGGIAAMNPVHLLRANRDALWHLTNWPAAQSQQLAPGIHGVSNGAFDAPWPKTMRLQAALADWIAEDSDDTAPLFSALADHAPLPAETDSEGPEQPFSPVFIRNATYGTRCSTVVLIDAAGSGPIEERSFDRDGREMGRSRLNLQSSPRA